MSAETRSGSTDKPTHTRPYRQASEIRSLSLGRRLLRNDERETMCIFALVGKVSN